MKLTSSWSSEEQQSDDDEQEKTQKFILNRLRSTNTVARKLIEATDTLQTPSVPEIPLPVKDIDTEKNALVEESPISARGFNKIEIPSSLSYVRHIASLDTQKNASTSLSSSTLPSVSSVHQTKGITPKSAILLIVLLCILVFHALSGGAFAFSATHGWAYALGGSSNAGNPNLLKGIGNQLSLTPATKAYTTHSITSEQYIDLILHGMTLDQKLGQMMFVQFTGPSYSLDLSTMISQYGIGAVLFSAANQNIQSKQQLKSLIQQMQSSSTIPLAVAIDQEGGPVDRLVSLDGPRPAASLIGASGDPEKATAAGTQDAQDLSSYGMNLNLAPVVDVTNVYNPQLDGRTYGNTAELVTKMAAAYLRGLQKSGKVLGALKHFPGLGDVGVDPHSGVPHLTRSRSELEQIDWAPYRTLIQQGNVHAVMVTHEIVEAIDSSKPSSLSYKVITGVLRNELGFQGVIITDSLTMEGIAAYYNEAQAAALSLEAGSDLLMGADTPSHVAAMVEGIKQAMNDGAISQQRIDDSVRRILMMKYEMGLLPIPAH